MSPTKKIKVEDVEITIFEKPDLAPMTPVLQILSRHKAQGRLFTTLVLKWSNLTTLEKRPVFLRLRSASATG